MPGLSECVGIQILTLLFPPPPRMPTGAPHLDGDAALALDLELVQELRLAASLDGARRLQQPVRQRRLACRASSWGQC